MVGILNFVLGIVYVIYIASIVIVPQFVMGMPQEREPHHIDDNVCTSQECLDYAQRIINIMDKNVDPCCDFAKFACGNWINRTDVSDPGIKSTKDVLTDQVNKHVHDAIKKPKEDGEPLSVGYTKTMYQACMNEDTIEDVGYTYFLDNFVYNDFGGWPMVLGTFDESNFCFTCLDAFYGRNFIKHILISNYVYQDSENVNNNVIYIQQTNPLVLESEMYFSQDSYTEKFDAYRNYISSLAKIFIDQAGSSVTDDAIAASVERIIDTETKIASIIKDAEQRRDLSQVFNPTTLDDLSRDYPNIDFQQYFLYLFADTDVSITPTQRVINENPEYFHALDKLLACNELSMTGLADYMMLHLLIDLTPDGPKELSNLKNDFMSVVEGTSQEYPRWKYCVDLANSYYHGLEYATGYVYVKEHFGSNSKAAANDLFDDLIYGFKDLVTESTWMDSDTQVLAKEKAGAMVDLLGYPDWILNKNELDAYYDGFAVPQLDTHLENVLNVMKSVIKRDLEELLKSTNKDRWIVQPTYPGSLQDEFKNTISYAASYLQWPMFNVMLPRYFNYGAIGFSMGTTVIRSSDDLGRFYDKDGKKNNWWSDDTLEAYRESTECFKDAYNNYIMEELVPELGEKGAHLNGTRTLRMNTAENGGLHVAYRAYQHVLQKVKNGELERDPKLPGLEMYTNEQLFFLSFSQTRCETGSIEDLKKQLTTSPVSPGKFRIIGPLSNSEDFARVFNCPVGSPMNREDKCVVW